MRNRTLYGLLALIVVVQLTLSLTRTFQARLWMNYPHENDTYRVVQILLQEGRFPVPEDYPPGEFAIRQGSQPPLYTLLAAPFVAPFDDGTTPEPPPLPNTFCIAGQSHLMDYQATPAYNPPYQGTAAGGYAFRVMNGLLLSGAVILTFFAGRALFPARPAIGLVAAAILAVEPYHIWASGTIVNDNLILLLAAATLYGMGRVLASPTLVNMLVLVGIAGLAVLGKLSGWVLLGGAVLVVLYKQIVPLFRRDDNQHGRSAMVIVLATAALIAGLVAYNQITVGHPLGRYAKMGEAVLLALSNVQRLPRTIVGAARYTAGDYLYPLQVAGLHPRLQRLYALATGLVMLGTVVGLVRALWTRQWRRLAVVAWLLIFIVVGSLTVFLRNHIAQTTAVFYPSLLYAPLRYYYTATPAAALLISYGLFAVLPERWPLARWNVGGIAVVAGWLVASVLIIVQDPIPAMLRQQVLTQAEFSNVTNIQQPAANATPLAGYNLETGTPGAVTLDMYLAAQQTHPRPIIGEVSLVDATGTETRCEFLPVRGLYPTTRWEPGDIVHSPLTVNNCTQPLTAPVDVRFRWDGGDAVTLATLDEPIPLSANCPENYGVVNDDLQITQIRHAEQLRRGDSLTPTVNYLVLDNPIDVQSRFYILQHTEQDTQYTCRDSVSIHGNVLTFQQSFGRVPPGERIFLDSCSLYVPPNAPLGPYDLLLMFVDADGNRVPMATPAGATVQGSQLRLGTVQIR